MTNKPEPAVTQQCDHAAAKSFESDIGCSLFADDLQLLAEAFAAHRTAAVARREAEIVGILQADYSQQCDGARECESDGDDDGAAGYFHAASMILGLMKKIQNGGGA